MKIEFFDDLDNLVYICIENMLFIECIMLYGFDWGLFYYEVCMILINLIWFYKILFI